jgi:hypothetical protein
MQTSTPYDVGRKVSLSQPRDYPRKAAVEHRMWAVGETIYQAAVNGPKLAAGN